MASTYFILTPEEEAVLFKPVKGQGGFQTFMRRLQSQYRRGPKELQYTDKDLEDIPHFAFDFPGGGGWEDDLKAIFSRHLGENLGRP